MEEYKAVDLASGFDPIWPSVDNIIDGVSDFKIVSNMDGGCMNVKEKCIGLVDVGTFGFDAQSRRFVEQIREKVQVPTDNNLNKFDLIWKDVANSVQDLICQTKRAYIPWDRLHDFVEGESNMRDFPCSFLEVPMKRNVIWLCKIAVALYY